MRQIFATAFTSVIVSLLTLTVAGVIAQSEPATRAIDPAAVSPINADKVDGRHAVGAKATIVARRGKLVATDTTGFLPSNIVKPQWKLIKGKPAGFADGVDDEGVTKLLQTYVVGEWLSIDPGKTGQTSVSCPSGSLITGGGFTQSAFDLVVTDSTFFSPTEWVVAAKNPSGGQSMIHAFAVCASTQPASRIGTTSRVQAPGKLRRRAE